MKIIILGEAKSGLVSLVTWHFEENDITLVDQSSDLLRRISDKIDIKPVVGFASHPDTLEQAGAENADIVIAVTGSDEVNMVACEVAQSVFKLKRKLLVFDTKVI